MKKPLTLLTVLFLFVSLCACANKPQEMPPSDVSVSETDQTPDITTKKEFSSGVVENNVYSSEFSDIKITAPDEKWAFSDKNYLYSLMKIDETADDTEKSDQKIAEKPTIYDALLSDNATGSNILVLYENLADNPDISEFEHASLVEDELNASKAYSYKASDPYTVLISNKKYIRLDCSAKIENDTVYVSYFIRKIDKYMLVICITPGVDGNVTTENMLSFIS